MIESLKKRTGGALASLGILALLAGVLAVPTVSFADEGPGPVEFEFITAPPTVSGAGRVGSTLNAVATGWTPEPASFSYQWMLNGAAIPGAISSSYVPVAENLGGSVSVTVTGSLGGYIPASAESSPITISAGALISAQPSISGQVAVGEAVTVKTGTWTPGVKKSYRWYANGKAISGATNSNYRITAAIGGKRLTVKVTGTLPGYATSSRTSASKQVLKQLVVKKPKITGTVRVGKTVSASAGRWTSGTKLSYQWLRNGAPIKSATKSKYALKSADQGKRIAVRVTGKKSGYVSATLTSASRNVPKVMKATKPRISGSAKVSERLSVKRGTWTSGVKFTYRWYRNGASIPGARSSGYTVKSADLGKRITVVVTGKKSGYVSEKRKSAATAVVTYPSRTDGRGGECPAWAPIKGNAESGIYHLPGGAYYNRTYAEECFATEAAAKRAGYRRSMR